MKKSVLLLLVIVLVVISCLSLVGCRIPDKHYDNVQKTLNNPNASESAVNLYNFLLSNYGKKVITGQFVNEYAGYDKDEFKGENGKMSVYKATELQAVYKVTGKYPAIVGLDLEKALYSPEQNYSIEQAKEVHNRGGIVLLTWHWNSPITQGDTSHFYTDKTNFRLKNVIYDKNSEGYKTLVDNIDTIAAKLKELADLNIPVLWRPLHEASGGWFWWGADTGKEYVELWNLMYDRMTNYHKLNNLIWVANPQKGGEWYVGDDKCDMLGDDPYYYGEDLRKEYNKDQANSKRFRKTYSISKNKMIAMSEIDFVPNIELMWKNNTKWLFYITWCREFVCVKDNSQGDNWTYLPEYAENYSTKEELKAVYNSDKAITLDNINWKK